MSKYHVDKAICPECGHIIETKIWDSINTHLNPELKKEILSGDLYKTTCPVCGLNFHFIYGFLYHDMMNEYMIGVEYDYSSAMKDFQVPNGYRLRSAADINHLIEKILLFDAGMNDIAIELTKKLAKKISNYQNELLYYFSDENTIWFTISEELDKIIQVPMKLYNLAYEEIRKKPIMEQEKFITVDEHYGVSLFAQGS